MGNLNPPQYIHEGVGMHTHTIKARLIGLFFILSFVSYGLGSGLIESLTSERDMLANISNNPDQLIIGVILMAILHTVFNIGLSVTMFAVLKSDNSILSYVYLCGAMIATTILVIGSLFLLLLLPLSDSYLEADPVLKASLDTVAMLLHQVGDYAYQVGMALWGLGGLALCYILYQSLLVPRFIAAWGFVGYTFLILGTILELFGYQVGVLLSLPGGLFELFLSVWLMVKGFHLQSLAEKG